MKQTSPWGDQPTQLFYGLTPEKILDALESALEVRCTGRAFAHNSMENRVYELEIDVDPEKCSSPYDQQKIVKFYRPGRWSEEQILEEHSYLLALEEHEIPVVAPLHLTGGKTLLVHPHLKLFFAVFPKVGGRSPFELDNEQIDRVGRLLARMHNVGATMNCQSRVKISPQTYGHNNLSTLLQGEYIPSDLVEDYRRLVEQICEQIDPLFKSVEQIQIHGDCHLGNLLWNDQGPFWVDFDDSVLGPPIQDLWLMILGRDEFHREQLYRLIRSYEMMREFDWETLNLIEPLRALRMIHFSGWIAKRSEDPAFIRAFPEFGKRQYWQQQIHDLRDQSEVIRTNPWK